MWRTGFHYSPLSCTRVAETVCFHCRIGLQDWLPEDKAFQEHGYWSPYCVYVRYVKGLAFYSECVKYRKDRFRPIGFDTVDS